MGVRVATLIDPRYGRGVFVGLPLRRAMHLPMWPTLLALAVEAVAALAQGALAVSLGALARILGGGSGHALDAAGMTWMSRVWSMLPPALAATQGTAIAVVGLLAVLVRGGAYILLEARETRDAARAAAFARLHLLTSALSGARGTIGRAVTWPQEVELGARAERSRLRAVVHLVVLVAVVVALDARLALVVIGILLPFAIVLRPIRRALREAHTEAARGAIATIDASRDLLEHAALWASCGGGPVAARRVEVLSASGALLAARAARGRAVASTSNEVLAALAVVVLVSVFAPSGPMPRAALLPVLVTLVSAYRPLRELAEAATAVERGLSAYRAIVALGGAAVIDAPPRAWPHGALKVRALAVDVGGDLARAGVDLDVARGGVTALVGAPGTGKSALLEALVGVRRGRGGASYGDVAFESAGIGPSQRPIAWVPPSPPVLPGTLAENLAPDAPNDRARLARAREILRALGDDTIAALADDALLGPGGRVPSSGECQRIALARALASEQPVLLLDEPTANLDEQGERRAIDVLRAHAADRCVVLVTHRAAPLALADRVVELSGQGVVRAAESERRIA